MDGATLTSLTFTLMQGPTTIGGGVSYSAATRTATFVPGALLGSNLHFVARITVGATDATGMPLVADVTWSFTTVPVELGLARTFSVLGGSVSNTGPTILAGELGVSPGVTIGGFPPGIANGPPHAADAAAAQARSDLQLAWNDAVARPAATTIGGDLAAMTLVSGVYHAAAAVSLSTTLRLDAQGDADAVFLFQIDGAFDTAAASTVVLVNGAQASHVFWVVTGAVTLGAMSSFRGNILCAAAITIGASGVLEGRALTLAGMVTLSTNTLSLPAP